MDRIAQWLLDTDGLTPHGFCLAWDPRLLWLHAGSNLAIAAAYYSIPVALLWFMRRRRDLAFPWVFGLFAAFILACGTTHLTRLSTIWLPTYWLDGAVMLATALVSVATAVALWPLLPRALALPSPESLRQANVALQHEITAKAALADRLAESRARLAAFFEHLPDMLAIVRVAPDGAARVEMANPAMGRRLSPTTDGAVLPGLALDHAATGQLGAKLAEAARDATADRAPRRIELSVDADDDGAPPSQAEALLAPMPGDDGGATVLISLRDVTERHALEARMAEMQKMEAVGQLTAGIAHDFNNVLMGLGGTLRLLPTLPADDPRRQAFTDAALQSIDRAAVMVRQLLAFARRQRLAVAVLDARAVLAAQADTLLAHALGGQVQVETDLQPALWPVLADRTQLEAAVLNLAINARDAMPHGGRLRIAARNVRFADQREADHALAGGLPPARLPPGEYVAISVADDGTGMPPEVARRAFEPFFTTKKVGEGTGLGLSQVYGFVQQSGGVTQIMSRPGQGTSVTIWLPRATDAPAAA